MPLEWYLSVAVPEARSHQFGRASTLVAPVDLAKPGGRERDAGSAHAEDQEVSRPNRGGGHGEQLGVCFARTLRDHCVTVAPSCENGWLGA